MEEERKLKILMLEDSSDDAFLIQRILGKDGLTFVTELVDTRDEFNEAIRRFQPDVILSDHGLPGFNSREALKIAVHERPYSPFILVTGSVSDEFAISCLRDGADDYVLKSNLSRLPMAIRSALKKRKLEKLKREARHALRKQNEELMKVNQELDNFVYSVSHNLRGPLASLLGLLTVAKEEDKEKVLSWVFDMMGTSMRRLDETLKEIVDFARNAREELQSQKVDWHQMFEASYKKLSYLESQEDFIKTLKLQTDAPFFTDQGRLGVVVTNLLSNAMVYHNKQAESRIDVVVHTDSEAATITISDNGIGIDPEIMPKVFNMFYRGTAESEGSGLGLYIAREITIRLKGTIKLTSDGTSGTVVTVVIPNMAGSDDSGNMQSPA